MYPFTVAKGQAVTKVVAVTNASDRVERLDIRAKCGTQLRRITDVPFIVSPSTADLSRKKPASAGTSRGGYRAQRHDKRETVFYRCVSF
jgi:hypothetical protein